MLREALFNGGCKDVIVPIPSSGGGSNRKGGSTTTVAWPLCSIDLRGIIVHFPVERAQPFGRALRVSIGGVTAHDVESAAQTASVTATATPSSDGGTVGTATATSSNRRASATGSSLTSVKKMGLDVSIAALGAAWIPGADRGGGLFGSAGGRTSRREFRRRLLRRASGNGAGRGPDGRDSEQPVVLDVRDAIGVKVRLVDDGAPLSGAVAAAAAAAAVRQEEGGSGFLRDMAEAATRVEERGDDLGVEELLPPATVMQEVKQNYTVVYR